MSVQNALRFIAAIRETSRLVERVQALGPGATIDRLVRIGAQEGYQFTAAELREAYQYDWSMRRARYSPPKPPGPSR
ncbi:MAG TPA: Nif11-like leader peptide family natural product precursor [Gemmatimonadales bacterium]|jgi:hypothetical protein|nr:Nif11-like leader peptide family natural product precursor [Gemmatimonadales bacterium]